jgi:hypothetical protein
MFSRFSNAHAGRKTRAPGNEALNYDKLATLAKATRFVLFMFSE